MSMNTVPGTWELEIPRHQTTATIRRAVRRGRASVSTFARAPFLKLVLRVEGRVRTHALDGGNRWQH